MRRVRRVLAEYVESADVPARQLLLHTTQLLMSLSEDQRDSACLHVEAHGGLVLAALEYESPPTPEEAMAALCLRGPVSARFAPESWMRWYHVG